jgi:hypothetical protein
MAAQLDLNSGLSSCSPSEMSSLEAHGKAYFVAAYFAQLCSWNTKRKSHGRSGK